MADAETLGLNGGLISFKAEGRLEPPPAPLYEVRIIDIMSTHGAGRPFHAGTRQAVLGFVRIVTNPRIWDEPTSTEDALEFIARLRRRSNTRLLTHGLGSWEIFAGLVRREPRAR